MTPSLTSVFTPPRPSGRACLAALVLASFAAVSWAQPASKAAADAAYEKDRAACMASDSQHERTSCLREAGAVRAEALRGAGSARAAESEDALARNALARCQRLPADQKPICERMVRGEGSTSGSVEGGGQIRELTIMEPVTPAGTTPVAPPAR